MAFRKTAPAQFFDYFCVLFLVQLIEEHHKAHKRGGDCRNVERHVVVVDCGVHQFVGNGGYVEVVCRLVAHCLLDVSHYHIADVGEHEHQRIGEHLDKAFKALARHNLLIVGYFREHKRLERGNAVEQGYISQKRENHRGNGALGDILHADDGKDYVAEEVEERPEHDYRAVVEFARKKGQEYHVRSDGESRYKGQRGEHGQTRFYVGSIAELAHYLRVDFYGGAHTTQDKREGEDDKGLVFEHHFQTLDNADVFVVRIGYDDPFLDLDQQHHEQYTHHRADKTHIAVSHIFLTQGEEVGADGADDHVHYGGGEAYQKSDGRPCVRALLLVGSDHAGHHLEGVVEQVPHYECGNTDAVSVNHPCAVVKILRLPGGGDCKTREDGSH